MERLTERGEDGKCFVRISRDSDLILGAEERLLPGLEKWTGWWEHTVLGNIVDRLAAYEDTGLAPEEVQQMRWIPVEEKLPKPEFAGQQRGFYLVALSNGTVKELMYEFRHYENMMFDIGWHETAHPVTHWMPLPQAPKEG